MTYLYQPTLKQCFSVFKVINLINLTPASPLNLLTVPCLTKALFKSRHKSGENHTQLDNMVVVLSSDLFLLKIGLRHSKVISQRVIVRTHQFKKQNVTQQQLKRVESISKQVFQNACRQQAYKNLTCTDLVLMGLSENQGSCTSFWMVFSDDQGSCTSFFPLQALLFQHKHSRLLDESSKHD